MQRLLAEDDFWLQSSIDCRSAGESWVQGVLSEKDFWLQRSFGVGNARESWLISGSSADCRGVLKCRLTLACMSSCRGCPGCRTKSDSCLQRPLAAKEFQVYNTHKGILAIDRTSKLNRSNFYAVQCALAIAA